MELRQYRGGHGTTLQADSILAPVDVPFISCVERLQYLALLAAIAALNLNLSDVLATNSLNNAPFSAYTIITIGKRTLRTD